MHALSTPAAPPDAQAQSDAALLLALHPGQHAAWVRRNTQLVYATSPTQPVLTFMLGAYAGPDAQALLRGRLYSTAPADAAAKGLVAVLGRRATHAVCPTSPPSAPPDLHDLSPAAHTARSALLAEADATRLTAPPPGPSHASRLAQVCALAHAPQPTGPRWAADRPVAAALHHPAHGWLAVAHNRAGAHRARHAELCALLSAAERFPAGPPDGASLYVSLQCCRMCAGLIATQHPSLPVYFAERDPGRLAQHTALSDREIQLILATSPTASP